MYEGENTFWIQPADLLFTQQAADLRVCGFMFFVCKHIEVQPISTISHVAPLDSLITFHTTELWPHSYDIAMEGRGPYHW